MRELKIIAAALSMCVGATVVTAAPANTGMVRTPDRLNAVLATVNGEPISLGDVLPLTQAREYQAAAAYSGAALEKEICKLRLEAVDDLIDNKLIVADYATKSFTIPERDVDAAIDEASIQMGCRSRGELVKKLREGGSSLEEFRKRVREQLIVQLMLHREYHASNFITPEDLHRYYREHKEEFSRQERIELAMLQLSAKGPEVENLVREISEKLAADPGTFPDLVLRFSSGPGRSDGGRLGSIERRRLRAEFASALGKNPTAGAVYGPLRTADGIFWLKVVSCQPGEMIPFERSGAEIRRRLEIELRRKCRSRYCARLRKNAIIRYFIPGAPETVDKDVFDDKNKTGNGK